MKTLLVVAAVVMALVGCGDSNQNSESSAELTEIKMTRMVRERLQAKVKDPDSAQFRNQRGGCGEINAKNSFGAYTGFKRFMASGNDMLFMEGDPALAAGAFDQAWNDLCGTNGQLATISRR